MKIKSQNKRKVQAQRKFAQGAYVPPSLHQMSRRDVAHKEDITTRITRSNKCSIPVHSLLDIVAFKNMHIHRQPIVLLERLQKPTIKPSTETPENDRASKNNNNIVQTTQKAKPKVPQNKPHFGMRLRSRHSRMTIKKKLKKRAKSTYKRKAVIENVRDKKKRGCNNIASSDFSVDDCIPLTHLISSGNQLEREPSVENNEVAPQQDNVEAEVHPLLKPLQGSGNARQRDNTENDILVANEDEDVTEDEQSMNMASTSRPLYYSANRIERWISGFNCHRAIDNTGSFKVPDAPKQRTEERVKEKALKIAMPLNLDHVSVVNTVDAGPNSSAYTPSVCPSLCPSESYVSVRDANDAPLLDHIRRCRICRNCHRIDPVHCVASRVRTSRCSRQGRMEDIYEFDENNDDAIETPCIHNFKQSRRHCRHRETPPATSVSLYLDLLPENSAQFIRIISGKGSDKILRAKLIPKIQATENDEFSLSEHEHLLDQLSAIFNPPNNQIPSEVGDSRQQETVVMSTEVLTSTQVPISTSVLTSTQVPISTSVLTSTQVPISTSVLTSTQVPISTSVLTSTQVPISTSVLTSTQVPMLTRLPTLTLVPVSTPVPASSSEPTSASITTWALLPLSVPTAFSLPTSFPLRTSTLVPTTFPVPTPTSISLPSPTLVPTSLPLPSPIIEPTPVTVPLPNLVPASIPLPSPTLAPTSIPLTLPTLVPGSISVSTSTLVPTATPERTMSSMPWATPVPTMIPMPQEEQSVPIAAMDFESISIPESPSNEIDIVSLSDDDLDSPMPYEQTFPVASTSAQRNVSTESLPVENMVVDLTYDQERVSKNPLMMEQMHVRMSTPFTVSTENFTNAVTYEKMYPPGTSGSVTKTVPSVGQKRGARPGSFRAETVAPKSSRRCALECEPESRDSTEIYTKRLHPTCSRHIFPKGKESAKVVDAPVFYPTKPEFSDPIAYIEKIKPIAAKFGICKIVAPPDFQPSCTNNDNIHFTPVNQYIARLFCRWGPAQRDLCSIKAHLASQSVVFTRAPQLERLEVNLPKLFYLIEHHGGLEKVIEQNRWARVAEEMRHTGCLHPERKLDLIYVKYLLPYGTLALDERQLTIRKVERSWYRKNQKLLERALNPLHRQKKLLGQSDSSEEEEELEDKNIRSALQEAEDCVVLGRSMNINAFKRVADNVMNMHFPQSSSDPPSPSEVERKYWRLVLLAADHVSVNSASIDTGNDGIGFTKNKNDPYGRHPWNLKMMSHNTSNVLRSLGAVLGVTVPTLHLGMAFSTSCWHRDPHGLAWMEYMHSGPGKVWYGIPDDQSENFRKAVETLCPTSCQNKSIWLPSDITMIPPRLLQQHNVSLSRVIQRPREFIVVFPKAYSCSIATGFTQSESVYFATNNWLEGMQQVFQEVRESCEPTMFSMERLLISIARDQSVTDEVLGQALANLAPIVREELMHRRQLLKIGFSFSNSEKCRPKTNRRRRAGAWNVREQDECEICRKTLYFSKVVGLISKRSSLCIQHAGQVYRTSKYFDKDISHVAVILNFSDAQLEGIVQNVKKRLGGVSPA